MFHSSIRLGSLLVLAALGACGGDPRDPEQYIEEFTDAYCARTFECSDAATVAFDGLTVEHCVAEQGPRFAAQWEGCKLDDDKADACLAAMPDAQCPEGGNVDDVLPVECLEAFEKCS